MLMVHAVVLNAGGDPTVGGGLHLKQQSGAFSLQPAVAGEHGG
jgi:hypothetical protein